MYFLSLVYFLFLIWNWRNNLQLLIINDNCSTNTCNPMLKPASFFFFPSKLYLKPQYLCKTELKAQKVFQQKWISQRAIWPFFSWLTSYIQATTEIINLWPIWWNVMLPSNEACEIVIMTWEAVYTKCLAFKSFENTAARQWQHGRLSASRSHGG